VAEPLDLHASIRDFWDRDAEVYDRSPTHAGTDPVEAAAWRGILLRHLPPPGSKILDVGAGTGAMSLLLASLGFEVTGLDLSPAMLEVARRKADALGLSIATVVGPAAEPPSGPFDAVVERHVLWTTPDPVAALRAWREVAPHGSLACYEGVFGRRRPLDRARSAAIRVVRAAYRLPPEHHGDYDPAVVAALPLASMAPAPLLAAVREAGWRQPVMERLPDVEWARRLGARPAILGWLTRVPHFAVLARAAGISFER
jgi:SAM-dependent methyltransferase